MFQKINSEPEQAKRPNPSKTMTIVVFVVVVVNIKKNDLGWPSNAVAGTGFSAGVLFPACFCFAFHKKISII
jgi:hypothetical protein